MQLHSQMSTMDAAVNWSDLPEELWPLIGAKLKVLIDGLRFRSVCHSWRSHLPPFQHSTPPPKFPFPSSEGATAFLSQNTVYLLRAPFTSSSTGWLVKLEESQTKLLLRNPITTRRVRCSEDDASFVGANLLDFSMIELGKSYFLRYFIGSGSVCCLQKVILVPAEFSDCGIMVICDGGKLGFAEKDDQKLMEIGHGGFVCDDIIVFKGHPYVVYSSGSVYRIDSSLKEVQVSSKLDGLGGRKHLVESCGGLYVVDRYYDQEPDKQEGRSGPDYHFSLFLFRRRRFRRFESFGRTVVAFKVYKLELVDEELGRWAEVKSLGDQVFFLAMDCSFSVSAEELAASKGNCIYFTDQNDMNLALREVTRPESFVFNLEDHSIQKLVSSTGGSQIYWPPPTELGASDSLSLD